MYFGKTTKEDYDKYTGSGKYWKRHIKKHGYNVSTEVIFQSEDINEITKFALKYSNENDIVNSDQWANLKEELGTDGGSLTDWYTEEIRKKMSDNRKGKVGRPTGWKHTEETRKKMSDSAKRRGAPIGCFKKGHETWSKGMVMSDEYKAKLSDSCKNQKRYTCEYCGKSVIGGNYSRWHGDNCKNK